MSDPLGFFSANTSSRVIPPPTAGNRAVVSADPLGLFSAVPGFDIALGKDEDPTKVAQAIVKNGGVAPSVMPPSRQPVASVIKPVTLGIEDMAGVPELDLNQIQRRQTGASGSFGAPVLPRPQTGDNVDFADSVPGIPSLRSGPPAPAYEFDPMSGGERPSATAPISLIRPAEGISPQDSARAANIVALHEATGRKLPLNFIDQNYDQITKDIGMRGTPTMKEMVDGMMSAAILAGLYSHPVGTIAGVSSFMAGKEGESILSQLFKGKSPELFKGEEFKQFLGPLNEPAGTAADVAEFLGPAGLTGAAMKRGLPLLTEAGRKIADKYFRMVEETIVPEKTYTLDKDKLRAYHENMGDFPEEEANAFKSLGLTGQDYKNIFSGREQGEITIPGSSVITIKDKPGWEKVKSFLRINEPIEELFGPEWKNLSESDQAIIKAVHEQTRGYLGPDPVSDTITKAAGPVLFNRSGRPYKTEVSATEAMDKKGLGETHKVIPYEKGYALEPKEAAGPAEAITEKPPPPVMPPPAGPAVPPTGPAPVIPGPEGDQANVTPVTANVTVADPLGLLTKEETPKPKVVSADSFLELSRKSDEAQSRIDAKHDELEKRGLSWEEQNADPELTALYEERIKHDNDAAYKAYDGVKKIISEELKGTPDKSTYASIDSILNEHYSLTPNPNGVFMMSKYTGKALDNPKTVEGLATDITKLLVEKDYPGLDFWTLMESPQSALTRAAKENYIKQGIEKAKSIHAKIRDYFIQESEPTPAVPATFREFIESKGKAWPVKTSDPNYAPLKAEYDGLQVAIDSTPPAPLPGVLGEAKSGGSLQVVEAPVPETTQGISSSTPVKAITPVSPMPPPTKGQNIREKAIERYRTHIAKYDPDPEARTAEIVSLIDSKDGIGLRRWMNGINPEMNRLFSSLTGLPAKTQKDADASLRSLDPEKWDKWQADKKAEKETKSAEREAANKKETEDRILDERVLFNGKEELTRRELYQRKVDEGYTIEKSKRGAVPVYHLVNEEGVTLKIPAGIVDYIQGLIDAKGENPGPTETEKKPVLPPKKALDITKEKAKEQESVTPRQPGESFIDMNKRQHAELAAKKEAETGALPPDYDTQYPMAKETVDGRLVRKGIPNQDSIEASLYDYSELDGVREADMSLFDPDYEPVVNAKTKALADAIKESGEINPLIVVIDKEGPYILEGANRYDALKIIGAKSFPAKVVIDNESIDSAKAAKLLPEGEKSPHAVLSYEVQKLLSKGTAFDRNQLFDMADRAFGGSLAENKYSAKDAYDAMEMGVNRYIDENTQINAGTSTPEQAIEDIKALKELTQKLPTQTTRTEETDKFQQFSTPPALAYFANWLAKLSPSDIYMEPSAGTGGLATFAQSANVGKIIVNELSPRRAAILRELGYDPVFVENAEQINNILPKDIRPTVIVMNPPFSATAGRLEKTSSKVGFQHIEQALKRLLTNGRLVAILGEKVTETNQFTKWLNGLHGYTLRADIGIGGKEYQKYGTTYGNQVIVIDKLESDKPVVKGTVDKIEDAIDLVKEVRDDRADIGEPRPIERDGEESPLVPESGAGEPIPVRAATGKLGSGKPEGERGVSGGKHAGSDVPMGTKGSNVLPPGRGAGQALDGGGGSKPGGLGGDDTGPDRGQAGDQHRLRQDEKSIKVEKKEAEKSKGELTDSVYEQYTPQKTKIPGAKKHPGKLVESAAMSVVAPPDPTYSPHIPKSIIESGKLSDAQLEPLVYAGQAHSEVLTDGRRRGYSIGDGTGVGKGRVIAGIILDNWNQGRKKAIWVSQNSPLIEDAKRDVKNVGWEPALVHDLSKVKIGNEAPAKEGIYFLGYDLLRSKDKKAVGGSRVSQLVDWFGKDYDGVIVFDEAHNMGNALAVRGARGTSRPSEKALAGVLLQSELPNARVVYVSATGATEVMNLSYADRLGLWGEGTPFANKQDFVSQISSGGIAAMELVARDMKAMGSYTARSLSYDDVKYEKLEHKLTPDQRDIYNALAEAWQLVLRNITQALDITDGARSGRGKSAALAQFWGAHQRFFNQVITSIQTPAVVKSIEKDLKNGDAVVIQIVNTNEADQRRAISRMEEADELEDLDLTPRAQLMEYVRTGFPVAQYEETIDDNGNTVYTVVRDSNGNPVENADAVALREALLDRIGGVRVPDPPLEMIINHFGVDKVAEITGRTRRVVMMTDAKGTHKVEERRSRSKTMADADAFMGDKKPILIFSYAGGTGRSYHADLAAINQRKRRHYLLQAGWRADRAIQGFGRTHRTNQKQAPEYVLVTTDIIGQKRFISSIARRLDQLGALTRGQRETGSGGFFTARDNLESEYAQNAIERMIIDIYWHRVPDSIITMSEFVDQTGLNLINRETGALNQDKIPSVAQFLNRLLSMDLQSQEDVFNLFAERLDENIRAAMEAGTLDVGLETLRAKNIKKLQEQVVHTDKSGALTKYVELEVTNDAKYIHFESAANSYSKGGFVKNIKSGQVWGVGIAKNKTNPRTGEIGQYRALIGPKYSAHDVLASDLVDPEKYEKLNKYKAKDQWDKTIEELPKTISYREHLVTGTILPIWDRLDNESTRILRVQTDDGERMIGRLINHTQLANTLNRLGASASTIEWSPEEIFKRVKEQGYQIELANGWRIVSRKVAGDKRIELMGPDYKFFDELKRNGAFTERISWETRVFIPTTAEGIKTIEAIIKNRPITNAIAPVSLKNDMGAETPGEGGPTLYGGLIPDPIAAAKAFRDVANDIKAAIPTLEALGEAIFQSGKQKAESWYDAMKKAMGDLWGKFKTYLKDVWKRLQSRENMRKLFDERGSFSTRKKKGTEEAKEPPKEEAAMGDREADEAVQQWEKKKDIWFGNKDVRLLKVKVNHAARQADLAKALGKEKYDKRAIDIDRAMDIYIDTKRSPGDVETYFDRLTPEQQRIVKLSQNLPDAVMPIVNRIQNAYEAMGIEALDEDVIKNTLDNYTGRVWVLGDGKKGSEGLRKFGIKTRHAKQRVFTTKIEGWANGYKLRYEGATTNLKVLQEELIKTIEDKKFLKALRKLRDIDGNALLSTRQYDGYERVEHPNFTVWEWAGKIEAATTEHVTETRRVLEDTIKGTEGDQTTAAGKVEDKVLEALTSRGWSKAEAEQMLNRVKAAPAGEQKDKIIERTIEKTIQHEILAGIQTQQHGKNFYVTPDGSIFERRTLYAPKAQAENMNNILGISALTRLPGVLGAGVHTVTKYNAIFKAWVLQSSFFHHLAFARNYYLGTHGKKWSEMNIVQAYNEGLDMMKALKPDVMMGVRNGLTLDVRQDWEEDLLKENTFIENILDKTEASKAVKDFIKDLRERQANFLFQELGSGLKVKSYLAEYRKLIEKNPEIDPDAASKIAAKLTNENYGGLHLGRMGRNPTAQQIFRLFCLAPDWTESNIRLVAGAFKKGEGGAAGRQAYQRLVFGWYLTALGLTALTNFLMAGGDINEMMKNYEIAWKQGNLKWLQMDITPLYKLFGGKTKNHKYFPLIGHMLDPIKLLIHPVKFAQNKGSVAYKMFHDALVGADWSGRRFTTLGELLSDGKTVKFGPGHPVNYDQLSSYAIAQLVGTEPVQIQNLIRWQMGEMEGFDAAMSSMGFGTTSTYANKKTGEIQVPQKSKTLESLGKLFPGKRGQVVR